MNEKLYCLYYYPYHVYPDKTRYGLQVVSKEYVEKYYPGTPRILDTSPDVAKLVKFKKWYISNATDYSVEMLHFLWNTFSAD